MSKRGMPTGPKGGALVVLLVLGAGLAGSSILDALPLGLTDVESTCLDGIDQPDIVYGTDPGFDFDASNPSEYCLIYPFSDGGGERVTPYADQGNNPGGYSVTVWDVAFENLVNLNGGDPCQLANFYLAYAYNGNHFDTDGTLDQANEMLGSPMCTPPPPPPP